MGDSQLQTARALAERDGPFLFFDSGRGRGESVIFAEPVDVWRSVPASDEREGVADDLRRWMRAHVAAGRVVAGYLGFEFGWDLDRVDAPRRSSSFPDAWVGAFEGRYEAVEASAQSFDPSTLDAVASWSPELDVSRQTYEANVAAAVAAIYDGELFEVNYTERFRGRWDRPPFELYERMRRSSTGSFFGFARVDDISLASVSPEEFLRVEHGEVRTFPIKGTRRRGDDDAEDASVRAELLASEKDRSENVMIVDLMRNDLTRYCEPGSVRATSICEVETFAGWHHLVSTVEGRLDEGVGPTDLLLGCFAPGSITGAPKLRSVELIAELEASARGPYTGTMFWADATDLRSNVLIRTAAIRDGLAEYGAGGAVVAESDPGAEYEEALLKATPFLRLGGGDGP